MRLFVSFLAIVILASCVRKNLAVMPPVASSNFSFIDLQPGWRLRAIVPLTKSGKIEVPAPVVTAQNGLALTVKTSPDLIGYETDYYAVRKSWTNLRIAFASANDTKDGVSSERSTPVADLFPRPPQARHFRLLYLTRVSSSDHNMALLGARNPAVLNDLTRQVERDPRSCQSSQSGLCLWVPAGVALRPELLRHDSGGLDWQPAQ